MTNINSPTGFTPVNADGRPYSGNLNLYHVPATDTTALYIGDPVRLLGSSVDGLPTIARAAANQVPVGVVCGFIGSASETIYRAASTARNVLVCDDPDALFEIQEDSVGGALTADSVGLNASMIAGTGSNITGRSGYLLDSSTADVTNTLYLQIRRLAPRPNNIIGANAKWLVRFNVHQLARGTTGI